MLPTVRDFPSTHPSLIAKLQDSHAEAWSRFFQRYQWVVLNWCRRKGLSLADAEDLTQSFMADAPRKLRTYQMVDDGGEPNRFRAWLKTVVDRKVIDYRRSLAVRTSGREAVWNDDSVREMTSELAEAYSQDIEAVVASVRKRVKPETWDAYERYELFDEPAKDIAESLGKTIGAVFVAVNRVNAMLAASGSLLNRTASPCIEDPHESMPERNRTARVHH